MAKAAPAREKQTSSILKCSICQIDVTPETYAAHIQTAHAPAPPQQTTQTMAASMPPWNSGGNNNAIQPISGPIMGKELAGGKYLKGEDIPDGVNEVRFRIVQFVRDPAGRSKLAAQISNITPPPTSDGKILFGFNTTNIRAVVGLGINDMQQIVGRNVVCMMGMAPNPSKGGLPTKALFIARIE